MRVQNMLLYEPTRLVQNGRSEQASKREMASALYISLEILYKFGMGVRTALVISCAQTHAIQMKDFLFYKKSNCLKMAYLDCYRT